MENDRNYVEVSGRLKIDPTVRMTNTGKAMTRFILSTGNTTVMGVSWEKEAEAIGLLRMGDPLHVRGRLQRRSYEQDGRTVYITEVVASEVVTLARAY